MNRSSTADQIDRDAPSPGSAMAHSDYIRHRLDGSAAAEPEREGYITAGWERCLRDYGLEPGGTPRSEQVDHRVLEQRRAQLGPLSGTVRAEMRRLFGQIAPSHYLLLLTDADGVILERMCEPGHEQLLQRVDIAPGFIWDEWHEGTNGPGTCLHDRHPRLVHRQEHFFARNIRMTCSAAPLFGPNGQLLGALDASHFDCADSREGQVPTLALMSMSARIIERLYFASSFKDCWIVRLHEHADMLGGLHAALLAVDEHGRVRAADSRAPAQLGVDGHQTIVGRGIDELFDVTVSRFFSHAQDRLCQAWPTASRDGRPCFLGIWPPQEPPPAQWPAAGPRRVPPATAAAPRPRRLGLADQRLGDPVMAHNVWCAERVMNQDVHILLLGETGTGKDTFARAIHQSGDRRDRPLVALSCAAIPEQLIESELFGYDAGAFTGARVGGMRGKVVAAHGGTLFLDEIGDMPLPLQARLLRVLEEKEVTPLGSSRTIAVDVRVISATNRDLAVMVERGEFRKDLYYRLNGMTLCLPPLRERRDRAALIDSIIAEEAGGAAPHLAPDARAALLGHPWPGNIRELRNVLRIAIAMAGGETIELRHLPPALAAARPAPASAEPATTAPAPNAGAPPDANPLAAAERAQLLIALERHRWKATATAAALGVSRNTLYRKLRKHGILVAADGEAP
jgi:sigma-54 dependent transcriptional regulator, acetoin dehydrogenase operon transcriptional activator AcoR